jgi:hypothetical protein
MAHAVRAHQECLAGKRQADGEELTDVVGTTPHAQASTHFAKEEDGWITFDKPILLFAGAAAYRPYRLRRVASPGRTATSYSSNGYSSPSIAARGFTVYACALK